MNSNYQIVDAALSASSLSDAVAVQAMIADALDGRNERPLGERYYNIGLLGSGGSFDQKLVEQVTNMQDAVLERHALRTFGSRENIPFKTPTNAANALLAHLSEAERGQLANVRFVESDGKPSRTKRLTAVFRDLGIGMTPKSICETAFQLGGSNKDSALHLLGAFGLGGALTYRNAESVVVVTRKAPELLDDGEEDRIAVAVVEWKPGTKGSTALYLVDVPWSKPGDGGEVWSCPASDYPEFEPGTHLALISYRVEGIYRDRESDEKSFPSILNTRLYRPVMPVTFTNETTRGRNTSVRGLERKLEQSQYEYPSDTETLVFRYESVTYHLPITYWLFPAKTEPGNRRSIVAHDHAVLFLSNGQVHHHWSPDEFKNKTHFNRLKDRVLIAVETDDLPISLRTQLFTSDRAGLVKADIALLLEEDVRAFIDDWDALREENAKLQRESLNATLGDTSAALGERIGRAIQATGYASSGGSGTAGSRKGSGNGMSGGAHGGHTKPIELLSDPTHIGGPNLIIAEPGKTVSRTFTINGPDDFLESRGQLVVALDHPDLDSTRDIVPGQLRSGRFRLQIAIPDSMEPGEYTLKLSITDWLKASGGLGPRLDFMSVIQVVDTVAGRGSGRGKRPVEGEGGGGPASGNGVVLRWSQPNDDRFDRRRVGEVELTPAITLAEADPANYGSLASLGETLIPTITLNQEYSPFKRYLAGRTKELETLERPRERYAIGVGVALALLDGFEREARQSGQTAPTDELMDAAARAAARAVLSVMPSFDETTREGSDDL